jgi:non-ribosomal peptide synthetase component F
LRASGVTPEVRVAICLERSLEMVATLLGILKSGGVCVPLSPGYPAERLAFMLSDSGASVLVTHSKLAEVLPDLPGTRLLVDRDQERIISSQVNPLKHGAASTISPS